MSVFLFLQEFVNKPVTIYLNSLTSNKVIEEVIYIFADVPIFIIPLFLIWFWVYYTYKKENDKKIALLFIFYSTIIAIIISLIIQQIVHIDRPEEYIKNAWNLILTHIPDASFPSDHASVSIAFLVSLYLYWYKKLSNILVLLFLIMLLSRVAWWVHWILDIVAWVVVWVISAFLIYKSKDFVILKEINKFILKISSYFKL